MVVLSLINPKQPETLGKSKIPSMKNRFGFRVSSFGLEASLDESWRRGVSCIHHVLDSLETLIICRNYVRD